jgi:hypothetical protein
MAIAEAASSSGSSSMPTPASGNSSTNAGAKMNATATTTDKAAASSASAKALRAKVLAEKDKNWAVIRAFVYFWVSLLVLFTLFLIGLVYRRYLRTMSCLSPDNSQAYFASVNRYWGLTKKHFIFAPLFRKRHHRPFMITRTIDNGCLPSRPQTFILVSYFIMLIFATFYGIDYQQPKMSIVTAVERRCGLLALSNMAPLFLLAARNNPLITLTGISFDSYNLFHRWLGRFVVMEIFGHVTAYFYKKVNTVGWAGYAKSVRSSTFIRSGTIVRNPPICPPLCLGFANCIFRLPLVPF